MASTAPRLWLAERWQGLLVTEVSLCFCRARSEDSAFSAAHKGGASPVFGLWEKEPEDCSKCLALACGPSLPAGIAGVANYSADRFIAIFLMGPGLSSFVLKVFLILSPASSCPIGRSVGFRLKMDSL